MFKHVGKPIFDIRSNRRKKRQAKSKNHLSVSSIFSVFTHRNSKQDDDNANVNANPEEVAENRSIRAFKSSLKFPATLISNREARIFYRMGTSASDIRKMSSARLVIAIIGFIVPLVLAPNKPVAWGIAIALPILIWLFFGHKIRDDYQHFTVKRQLHFDQFMSVLTPYLYRMNKQRSTSKSSAAGMSMNAILTGCSRQIDDKQTKRQVDLLSIDVAHDKTSFRPYQRFARSFTESPRAFLFMTSVYHMSQGAVDDSSIRALNHSAMEDLLDQVKRIKRIKLARFPRPLMVMALGWFLLLTYYFGLMMAKLIIQQIMQVHGL